MFAPIMSFRPDPEEASAFHSGEAFELDGEVVVPIRPRTLNHGRVCTRIALRLWLYAWRHRLGEVFCNGTGFVLQHQPAVVRGPDVCFVSAARLQTMNGARPGLGAPDLCVDVVSRERELSQALARVAQVLDAGGALAWIVDLRHKRVLTFDAKGRSAVVRDQDVLRGDPVLPGFEWPVHRLFGLPWV